VFGVSTYVGVFRLASSSPSQSGAIEIAKEVELELTRMLAAVAGGIAAVHPGCSSLGWPFLLRFVG
jgi:hypothetical protein